MRNINYNSNEEKIKEIFSEYGEIKKFFALIPGRGMCFITYFDLRNAIKAKDLLHDYELDGRRIDPHFSLPRDNDEGSANIDTLKVSFSDDPPNETELRDYFTKFGDIEAIIEGSSPKYFFFKSFFFKN